MRQKSLFHGGKTLVLSLLAAVGLASCADVYDGDEKFDTGVRNQQLASPAAGDITVKVSTDGSSQTISWPVVYGASGYEVKFVNVTDAENPVVLVDKVIDGCSFTTSRQEDNFYSLSIKTIGNQNLGNKDALEASVKTISTFAAAYKEIPAGVNLAQWFNDNPIPADSIGVNLIYDLAAGGEYTLDGEINFGLQKATIRTTSKNKATIVYGESSAIATNAGLTLKNLHLDCSKQTTSNAAVFELCQTPFEELKGLTGKDSYNILDPISMQDCDVEGVNGYIFYDNNKKYAVHDFLIKNCTFHLTTNLNTLTSNALINAYGGGIFRFKMENSTVWSGGNTLDQKYLLRYNNSFREDRVIDDKAFPELNNKIEVALISSTFYNSFKSGQIANYDGIVNRAVTSFNMTKCIFVDCGSGQIPRRFIKSVQGAVKYTWLFNTYWFNGASEVKEDGTGATDYDKSGTILSTDPAFVDPDNGNFTPTGAEQLANGCGDPRWLPAN